MKSVVTLAVAVLLAPHSLAAEPCLTYGPHAVTLHGVVRLQTFFGPPNYGESPTTDSKEDQAILLLDTPICVFTSKSGNEEGVMNQFAVTLVSVHGRDLRPFAGKRAIVEGVLFHANTGHHHTPVLIQLELIEITK